VEASALHPLSSALEGMDAKWHEALKQHEPFFSPQFLFLHLLFQKNQTFKKTGVTTTEAEGVKSNIMHGILSNNCDIVIQLFSSYYISERWEYYLEP